MNLITNGRLTDLGAIIATLAFTVVLFWAVLHSKAGRADPERLSWPSTPRAAWDRLVAGQGGQSRGARREARRLTDAADLAAANKAGR